MDQAGRIREAQGPASKQSYRYDDRDRLTKVEDTTESGCTTRVYGFSKDSNRSALTSYAPDTVTGNEGACRSTGSPLATSTPSFDDADRITSTGYTYDALGRTKTVPGADTNTTLESPSDLTVGYHANDMVATLSQSGTQEGASVTTSQDFSLDVSGRISTIQNLTGGVSLEESTNHYDGGDDSPAWTETKTRPNGASAWASAWTRNIASLDGDLGIIQASTGTPKVQFANLHGDVVSTAQIGATGMDSYTETDEYGVPRGAPSRTSRYGWLGAKQRQSDGILGGLTLMGARLYAPVTGRFLSRDPVRGGSDNPYVYPADPVNVFDLDGRCYIDPNCYAGYPQYRDVKKSNYEIGREGERKAYRQIRDQLRLLLNPTGIKWKLVMHPPMVRTPYGRRFPDIALKIRGKIVRYYEVKANSSRYTSAQRRKDKWIEQNLGIETVLWRVKIKKTKRVCVKNCQAAA